MVLTIEFLLWCPDEKATVVIKMEKFPWKGSNINSYLKYMSVSNSDMIIDYRLFLPSQNMYDDRMIFCRLQEALENYTPKSRLISPSKNLGYFQIPYPFSLWDW